MTWAHWLVIAAVLLVWIVIVRRFGWRGFGIAILIVLGIGMLRSLKYW